MTFKDAATADLPTFLNVDEFANAVEIDGVPVACILDETETTHAADGVTVRETTLHARAADLPEPVVDQRMQIGDRLANVTNVDEQQGMRVIRLRWWDS
jgi:hypothetical protein